MNLALIRFVMNMYEMTLTSSNQKYFRCCNNLTQKNYSELEFLRSKNFSGQEFFGVGNFLGF